MKLRSLLFLLLFKSSALHAQELEYIQHAINICDAFLKNEPTDLPEDTWFPAIKVNAVGPDPNNPISKHETLVSFFKLRPLVIYATTDELLDLVTTKTCSISVVDQDRRKFLGKQIPASISWDSQHQFSADFSQSVNSGTVPSNLTAIESMDLGIMKFYAKCVPNAETTSVFSFSPFGDHNSLRQLKIKSHLVSTKKLSICP